MMNKNLIQKLLDKSCWDQQAQIELEDQIDIEKFAELIVQECVMICNARVSSAEYNTGRMHCASDIQEHFGIE